MNTAAEKEEVKPQEEGAKTEENKTETEKKKTLEGLDQLDQNGVGLK